MAKTNITQYSSTPSSNTDINSINIDENCPASGLNNAIRELMAHLKNVDTGSQALTALSVAGSVTATTSLKTPLIEFTDGDNALTIADGGNVTANADLTVSGALSAKGGAVFNEDSADVDFRVEGDTNTHALFVQGGSDKVAIGNSNPNDFGANASDLVIGTTSGEHGLTIATGTGNSARMQFADNTSSPFVGAIEYAHSNNHMYFYTNGSQQLKITHGGFIQSPPTASNTVSSSANMFITSGGEFAKSTSSRRFKNTINDATHGLTELLQLRSVTYKGNNDGDIVFGGLIAEEVHDVGLTEFVQYDDEDRPESLHYTHMVALCVKAIQELSAKVTTLETENATQATQIADLISRVTALENA